MKIARINNPELIKDFVTSPELYKQLSEDDAPEPEAWYPNLSNSIWVLAYEDSDTGIDIIGMFAFVPETTRIYKLHPAINPEHWDSKKHVLAGKLALSWLAANTKAAKVIATCPQIYPDALRWAQRVGFKREGVQRSSYLKDGTLGDQYYMGISC